ncbi:HNH endonuclease [Cedecea lapagei]|uniref:HNH endonuclease n=1 Tax=Cedecea lapagei TaxID=158823 RepID=UPI001BCE3632|nr:HNH endonuclease [Cedecea lapagei]
MSIKLPDFLEWGLLNSLRNEMKAPLAKSFTQDTQFVPIDIPIIERLRNAGIDINIDELQIHSDGTLIYKGYRVLLYIRDISSMGREANMPKYHLAYCQTLEKMHKNDRFNRYVVANDDSGSFQVNVVDGSIQGQSVKLSVCQNCLDKIHWKGFDMQKMLRSVRLQLVSQFSLVEFFNTYSRDLISVTPKHTSVTAPLNDYSMDWPSISKNTKLARGYKCQSCNIILNGNDSKYLHVHHRNGQKYDNKDSNLDVLCVFCHANQPMHGHIKITPQYSDFIAKYPRREN